MEFNEKVLYVRAILKLSQIQLAKELKVSLATINRWETAKTFPNKLDEYSFNLFCNKNNINFDEESK